MIGWKTRAARAEAVGCATMAALGMGIICSSGLLPEDLTLKAVMFVVTAAQAR
jgi:hypothetical protein